jgi:hypothetical protein
MKSNVCSPSTVAGALPETSLSLDALEQILIQEEHEIARHRALQLAALELLDRSQVATADGARTLEDWLAARLDVGHDTSRRVVQAMRRTEHRPELREALARGDASFDRVEASARIAAPASDPLFRHLDVDGVRREAATRARIGAIEEHRDFLDNHLVMQPNLDQSRWRLWGGLDGVLGAIVDRALTDVADQLPIGPEAPMDQRWRRAMALTQLCVEAEPSPAQISVFIDAGVAVASNGEAGLLLEAGPTIGPDALRAILCDAFIDVTVVGGDGEPMRYGRRSRTIPPRLRRAIIRRDGNRCVVDGCSSRNRLQVHHVIPWSRGGLTDPDNLITVCWYHHHVAIHRSGLTPYRHPDHGRYRLGRRAPPRPPPD